jgi:rare lipoprotein A
LLVLSYVLRALFAAALGVVIYAPAGASADNALGTTATYYHPSLHGGRMANGEIYNRWDPAIAASNWYPLGTLLRVTRQETGEHLYVHVKDRGSRALTLDLSEAGFSHLGGLREGRIRVWIERVQTIDGEHAGRSEVLRIRPLLGQLEVDASGADDPMIETTSAEVAASGTAEISAMMPDEPTEDEGVRPGRGAHVMQ